MPRSDLPGKGDDGLLKGDLAPPRRWSNSEMWAWVLVAVGVLLRVAEYSDNRQLYADEEDLRKNLVGLAFYDFQTPLVKNQLASPGFLAVERLMILLPLPFPPAARLIPFVCSIASMFLMRSVARRYLTAAAVPIAVGLFALTDWLLYYSVEIKQYSSDAALALTALLLVARAQCSHQAGSTRKSRRDFLVLTAFGAIGVWFSHPLALVLAGVGSYLILKAVFQKDWGRTIAAVGMSALWALNFAGCYWVSDRLVSKDGFLERWWGFAFLPFPPRSLADLERIFWQSINVFNSPSGILTPLGVLPSAFIACGLFLLGAFALGRRWKGGLYLLISPIVMALAASMLHRYPFHGRLLIFLIPSIHLLVAQGAAALARPGGPKLTFVLAVFVLAQPVLDVLWYRLIQKRHHGEYDSHGDLHPDLLDYLETVERTKALDERMRRARANRVDTDPRPVEDGQPPAARP
jgi:hypothetical protein